MNFVFIGAKALQIEENLLQTAERFNPDESIQILRSSNVLRVTQEGAKHHHH